MLGDSTALALTSGVSPLLLRSSEEGLQLIGTHSSLRSNPEHAQLTGGHEVIDDGAFDA
jgi:hypothetical protein